MSRPSPRVAARQTAVEAIHVRRVTARPAALHAGLTSGESLQQTVSKGWRAVVVARFAVDGPEAVGTRPAMSTIVRYVVASTARAQTSDGWERGWAPAGEVHAFCLMRGSRPSVSMCGRDIASLHVFEDRPFLRPRTGAECRDCREWVQATSSIGA
jgi:hypothetical protein